MPYTSPNTYSGGEGDEGGGDGRGGTTRGGPYDRVGGELAPYQERQIPLTKLDTRKGAGPVRGVTWNGDGMMSGLAALGGIDLAKDAFEKTAEAANIQAGLQAQGFSTAQAKMAMDEAFAVQRTVAGSGVLENLRLLADLQATFQKPAEALEMLKPFAKMQVQLGRFGQTGESELIALIKGVEEKGSIVTTDKSGKTEIDRAALDAYLQSAMAAVAVTRGQIDPRSLLQFQRH